MATQLSSVTGRRTLRPRQSAAVEARAPFVTDLRRQREEQAFQNKQFALQQQDFGLREQQLEETKRQADEQLALGQGELELGKQRIGISRAELEAQKKASKTASKLGAVQLGVTGALAAGQFKDEISETIFGGDDGGVSKEGPGVLNRIQGLFGGGETPSAPSVVDPGSFVGRASRVPTSAPALRDPSFVPPTETPSLTFGGGVGAGLSGFAAGSLAKNIPIGSGQKANIAKGAVAGGVTGFALSGGNPWATAISAITGGFGGGGFGF